MYPDLSISVRLTFHRRSAPKWSADRAMKQFPEFMNISVDGPEPILFTGEMV